MVMLQHDGTYICCILTLNRTVNQRSLWTERLCVNGRKQSRGSSEVVGAVKWYMQMCLAVREVGVSEGLSQTQLAVTESTPLGAVSHRASGWIPRLRSSTCTKWGLEDNTACYGQEKLWVNVAMCLSPFFRPSSHTREALTSRRIKKVTFL